MRGVTRLNFSSTSWAVTGPVIRFAALRIFCLTFRTLFTFWVGFRITAAPETMIEQTRQTARATITVPETLSLLNLDTSQSPLDVGLHDQVVDIGRKQVSEEHRQHHALGIGGVDHPNQYHHQSDQNAEDPLTSISHGCRHRIRGHEHHGKGEATQYEVPMRDRKSVV